MTEHHAVVRLSVHRGRLNIHILAGIVLRNDDNIFAVIQMHGDLIVKRRADHILSGSQTIRVEAQSIEYIPG